MIKVIKNLSVVIIAVTVIVGGAYAWQLQKESISGIAYVAGSMDLKIADENSNWLDSFATDAFNQSGLEPGEGGAQIIKVKSEGDTEAKLSLEIDLLSNKENSLLSPEAEAGDVLEGNDLSADGELARNMKIKISFSSDNGLNFTNPIEYTVEDWNSVGLINLGNISNSEGIGEVKLEWNIPQETSNIIMTDSIGIKVVFGLE